MVKCSLNVRLRYKWLWVQISLQVSLLFYTNQNSLCKTVNHWNCPNIIEVSPLEINFRNWNILVTGRSRLYCVKSGQIFTQIWTKHDQIRNNKILIWKIFAQCHHYATNLKSNANPSFVEGEVGVYIPLDESFWYLQNGLEFSRETFFS